LDECKPLGAGGPAVADTAAFWRNLVGRCRLPLSNPRSKRLELSSQLLILIYEVMLSFFAFNFYLRRYSLYRHVWRADSFHWNAESSHRLWLGLALVARRRHFIDTRIAPSLPEPNRIL